MVFFIILILIVYCIALLWLMQYNENGGTRKTVKKSQGGTASKCSMKGCAGMDPVSDPKYNCQQIVKQSILLEEHLSIRLKRCRDCITKHFLHIIGLAEEAQMLATNKIDQYPLINECVTLYNKLFQKWLKNDNEHTILCIVDDLRTMRKQLIAIYFFDNEYMIE